MNFDDQILPELRAIFEDRLLSTQHRAVNEPYQLMEAFAQFVSGLVSSRPVLVVIEDLHWSDDASLDALPGLVRRSVHQPILLLTYRRDEVSPGLPPLLTELHRARAATELVLQPLTPDEIDGMLRAIFNLAGPVRAEFLDAIAALTDGNPFLYRRCAEIAVRSRGKRSRPTCWHVSGARYTCRSLKYWNGLPLSVLTSA
jgi:predicted ATPase